MKICADRGRFRLATGLVVIVVACSCTSSYTVRAEPESPCSTDMTPAMTLEAAVQYALENNPQLAALRRQHGIAAAGVVIARTYPFNPIAQSAVQHARGPNVTNSVPSQHQVTLELEILGQRHFRKQAAFAALTRTDWEIAFQEVTFAVNAVRAFDSLLYRQAKLGVVEEFLRLNEKATEQVGQLVERGTLRPPDLILARTEVNTVRTQVGLSQTALESAKKDLARALGMNSIDMPLQGTLDRAVPDADEVQLLDAAREHRPDLFARQSAVTEAEARVKLQLADRFGHPAAGPVYQFNESKVEFIGGQVSVPLPLFNRRQGEIQQLKEQQAQAMLYLRQTEIEVRQDVHAAFTRLLTARTWVDNYRKEVLPDLRKSLEDMDRLFRQGQAGVDVLRVLDVRRALLRAQDGYVDALQIYTQALADLAQAVGDPTLVVGCYQQSEELPAPKPLPEAMPPK